MAKMPDKMPLGVIFSGQPATPLFLLVAYAIMIAGAIVMTGLATGLLVPR